MAYVAVRSTAARATAVTVTDVIATAAVIPIDIVVAIATPKANRSSTASIAIAIDTVATRCEHRPLSCMSFAVWRVGLGVPGCGRVVG